MSRYRIGRELFDLAPFAATASLRTNIMDFRGFDSSMTILIIRGVISRPMGDFEEYLSQAMLVGIMLVGRLGVAE